MRTRRLALGMTHCPFDSVPRRVRFLGAALILGCAAMLASVPTVISPVRLLTNAYVMDGTTLPTPSPGFVQSAVDDFITPAVPGLAPYTAIPLTTPENVIGINQSVADGMAAVEAAMAAHEAAHPGEPFAVFGYSQSTVITMLLKAKLEEKKARGEPVPNVIFVGIGGGDWGSSITARLDGLVVPLIDFTFNGLEPSDPAHEIPTIKIARQYDGFADTAQFVTNPVALANSLLGSLFVHGLYGQEVSLDPTSPKYVPGTIKQQHGLTTYYWIPTADLPLFDPLRLAGVPEPLLDIVEPFFRELVEAGYDRTVPFNQPTPAQLIPVIDPITLTIKLAGAALEGINNAAKALGAELPGYALLNGVLEAAESASAAAIGAPYRALATTINEAFNPVQAFNSIEAPIAENFNSITNGLGIPAALNQVVRATLFPISAWGEDNLLFPQSPTSGGPLAAFFRQFLQRVAPGLGTNTTATATVASTQSPAPLSLTAPEPTSADPSTDADASADSDVDVGLDLAATAEATSVDLPDPSPSNSTVNTPATRRSDPAPADKLPPTLTFDDTRVQKPQKPETQNIVRESPNFSPDAPKPDEAETPNSTSTTRTFTTPKPEVETTQVVTLPDTTDTDTITGPSSNDQSASNAA